jgi:plasmid stabilization system protein ParE
MSRVILAESSERQIEQIDAWWREHRPSAPSGFARELAFVLADLEVMPRMGQLYEVASGDVVHWLPLRGTGHKLYYLVQRDYVEIVAVVGPHEEPEL